MNRSEINERKSHSIDALDQGIKLVLILSHTFKCKMKGCGHARAVDNEFMGKMLTWVGSSAEVDILR